MVVLNGWVLYDAIKSDIRWKKVFAELGYPVPWKARLLGYFAKTISAISCAWMLYRAFTI